jgi:hypothetical protein
MDGGGFVGGNEESTSRRGVGGAPGNASPGIPAEVLPQLSYANRKGMSAPPLSLVSRVLVVAAVGAGMGVLLRFVGSTVVSAVALVGASMVLGVVCKREAYPLAVVLINVAGWGAFLTDYAMEGLAVMARMMGSSAMQVSHDEVWVIGVLIMGTFAGSLVVALAVLPGAVVREVIAGRQRYLK